MVAQNCHRDFVVFSAFFFYMNGFSYFILFYSFYSIFYFYFILFHFHNNLKWKWKWKEIKPSVLNEINLKAKSIESKWN